MIQIYKMFVFIISTTFVAQNEAKSNKNQEAKRKIHKTQYQLAMSRKLFFKCHKVLLLPPLQMPHKFIQVTWKNDSVNTIHTIEYRLEIPWIDKTTRIYKWRSWIAIVIHIHCTVHHLMFSDLLAQNFQSLRYFDLLHYINTCTV